MKKLFTFVIFAALIFAACKKNNPTNENQQASIAIVKDYGPIELDGCGWVIEINGTVYHPTNLSDANKIDNDTVSITYTLESTTFQCGLQATSMQEITIETIQ